MFVRTATNRVESRRPFNSPQSDMDRDELVALLALSLSDGLGAKRVLLLRDYFSSALLAMSASANKLEQIPGIGRSTALQAIASRNSAMQHAERIINSLQSDIGVVTYYDVAYPEELRAIFTPPPILFTRGNIELLSAPRRLAIIGTRRATDYGKSCVKMLCTEFVNEGVVITSGFAQGIDTTAHQSCFQSGGSTIAVFGCGVDVIYPSSNAAFARELASSERGLLISEFLPGAKPDARNFPWRNRIVSGLSHGVLVVESELRGGSMLTASLALDQNRDIFAIPGDINRPLSSGPNSLISDSRAKLAISGRQIMEDLGWVNSDRKQLNGSKGVDRSGLTLFESQLVEVLEAAGGPLHIDTVSERSMREVQDILVTLLQMELKGVVRQMAGKQFTLFF